jgi:hypothetical protein
MLLSEGQMSDYKGAALMLPAMPKAKELLADKGYDADWFRAALTKRGVAACIPSKSNRKVAIPYDAVLYKQRHSRTILCHGPLMVPPKKAPRGEVSARGSGALAGGLCAVARPTPHLNCFPA